jgi:hypothetical protein
MRRLTLHSMAFKNNFTGSWFKQTDQRLKECGLTHSIPADETNHFPSEDPQINISKNMALAVIGVETPNLEHCH